METCSLSPSEEEEEEEEIQHEAFTSMTAGSGVEENIFRGKRCPSDLRANGDGGLTRDVIDLGPFL